MDIQIILTLIGTMGAVLGGQGFWKHLENRKNEKKGGSAESKLLKGIAADRIQYLCRQVIAKGYILYEEHETIMELYEPFKENKGNGHIKKLIETKIEKLHIFETNEEGKEYLEEKERRKQNG